MSSAPAELPQWGPTGTSLAQTAYEAIKEKLILLRIGPGEPISETELADELGVGRTPIREALKRLEGDHLVVSYPRRGTFAAGVDIAELAAVTELRRALEPVAASAAAERANAQQRDDLRAAIERIRNFVAEAPEDSAGDGGAAEAFLRLDTLVHHTIYQACGNAHIADILARYHYLAMRIWALAAHRLPGIIEHAEDHIPLLEAIVDGQADKAATMTVEHIDEFERSLRAMF